MNKTKSWKKQKSDQRAKRKGSMELKRKRIRAKLMRKAQLEKEKKK